MEYKAPGRYIPIIYLLYSWGSLSFLGRDSLREFSNIRGTFLRAPIIRTIEYIGVYIGSPYLGKLPYMITALGAI